MTKENLPNLFQFLAGYFHEDWRYDNETEDDVTRRFIIESPCETVAKVKNEISLVLNNFHNEKEMQAFLFDEIKCSYYYLYAWPSGKSWLEHVLAVLCEANEKT
ncbi:hypothetical protein HU727_025360 [Pseudomonas sp. SWRI153]|uniref:CdiI immunity protein domain-containing protein n=1 Tax=Pseudomonas khorasanensis TaxID=2745508 RepID=A0A923F990_9PSED|nr:contact-dependent growth inhibition system immunity protein [Pseudomonas khorasanensis]MBV4488925.1 hypothetical protein [Pseudomonas khorasanensis]